MSALLALIAVAIADPLTAEEWLSLLETPIDSTEVRAVLDDRYYRFTEDEFTNMHGVSVHYWQSKKRGVALRVEDGQIAGVSFRFSDDELRPYRGELPFGLDGDGTIGQLSLPFEEIDAAQHATDVGGLRVEVFGNDGFKPRTFRIRPLGIAIAQQAELDAAIAGRRTYTPEPNSDASTALSSTPMPQPAPFAGLGLWDHVGLLREKTAAKDGVIAEETDGVDLFDGSPHSEVVRCEAGKSHHFYVVYPESEIHSLRLTASTPNSPELKSGRKIGTNGDFAITWVAFHTDIERDVTFRIEPHAAFHGAIKAAWMYATGPFQPGATDPPSAR